MLAETVLLLLSWHRPTNAAVDAARHCQKLQDSTAIADVAQQLVARLQQNSFLLTWQFCQVSRASSYAMSASAVLLSWQQPLLPGQQ